MSSRSPRRPQARSARGFKDTFAADIHARDAFIAKIRAVYERYGFEPLETPALEYVDVLGKFLPESDTPAGGIFALKDDEDQWLALRYDLTAPLSRVVVQWKDLPRPFRRYQIGPVWRMEKPGPGRFREFYQFDIDTVGSSSPAADAEVCCVLADAMDAIGIKLGDYAVRVNNRKVLNGVLEAAGVGRANPSVTEATQLAVLRSIDKFDRVGYDGVRDLLGEGRTDPSGDFTPGAGLAVDQIERVLAFVQARSNLRAGACADMRNLVSDSAIGLEGVEELEQIDAILTASGYDSAIVQFDPSVVRGLAYYTGPVFETHLTFPTKDQEGAPRAFGAVAGGGRYDDLVRRFTGELVPATGASIGVDRLYTALKELGELGDGDRRGPVVVTAMDRAHLREYASWASILRKNGVRAEMYLGTGDLGTQLRYADRRGAPVAIIAGQNEFDTGQVSLKNLRLGHEVASHIASREEWLRQSETQRTVDQAELVAEVKRLLADAE